MRAVNVPLGRSAPRDNRTLPLGRVYVAFDEYSEVQRLAWRAKVSRSAAEKLAAIVADRAVSAGLGGFGLVTYVPGSPDRIRERGYDVPALIAVEVADRLNTVYWPLLVSVPHVRQSAQTIDARWDSALRSYTLPRDARQLLHRWSDGGVLVVDDVCSSGATMAACMSVVRSAAPSRSVYGLVAGHPAMRAKVWRQFGVDW